VGFEHMKSREFREAVDGFTRALEENPSFKEAYFNRGNAYIYLSQFDDAIEDFNTALRIDPEYADAWYCLGLTNILMGNREKAKAYYEKACKLGSERACAKLEGLRNHE